VPWGLVDDVEDAGSEVETACVNEEGAGGVFALAGGTIASGATAEPGLAPVGVNIACSARPTRG
jgi:hypothetical protein